MSETKAWDPTTSVSTFGVQAAYGFSSRPQSCGMIHTGLKDYGLCALQPQQTTEGRERPTTRPVSRGEYFARVPQSPVIEYCHFRTDVGSANTDAPIGTPTQWIDSSMRDVSTMLFVAGINARAAGKDTRPLIRPQRKEWGGIRRTWIAQKESDITDVVRTLQAIHRRSVLAELIERASKLGELQNGWNSYTARAPTAVAISNAKTLLTMASVAGNIPERIEPSAMGGVGVTFTAGNREVTVEFYNSGSAHALFSDNAKETLDTAPVVPRVDDYRRLLQDIRGYLHGYNAPTQAPRPELPRP